MGYLDFLFGVMFVGFWIFCGALYFSCEVENEDTEVQKEEGA